MKLCTKSIINGVSAPKFHDDIFYLREKANGCIEHTTRSSNLWCSVSDISKEGSG